MPSSPSPSPPLRYSPSPLPNILLLSLLLTSLPSTQAFSLSITEVERWMTRRAATLGKRADVKVPDAGYYNPLDNGGSFLTAVAGTYPPAGEPLNLIISGHSDADVLDDNEVKGGLRNYFLSFGFSSECLGQQSPGLQLANLGDGNPPHNETAVIRWNYGDPQLGTCKETIEGGNHFRYWTQNGPDGNSGAVFLAASYELPIAQGHNIAPNGYNLGRDEIIGNITHSPIPTSNISFSSPSTPGSPSALTYSGTTQSQGFTYQTDIIYVSGLLPNSSDGVNHNESVVIPGGGNAVDGLVAVLTVKITERPKVQGNFAMRHPWPSLSLLALLPLMFFVLS